MRTKSEIEAEIECLKTMKPTVRHFTFFHDDNWSVIDAQIKALAERMDDDDVWSEWEDSDEEYLNQSRERDGAGEAVAWMNGYSDSEAPSKGWLPLVTPPVNPDPEDIGIVLPHFK